MCKDSEPHSQTLLGPFNKKWMDTCAGLIGTIAAQFVDYQAVHIVPQEADTGAGA